MVGSGSDDVVPRWYVRHLQDVETRPVMAKRKKNHINKMEKIVLIATGICDKTWNFDCLKFAENGHGGGLQCKINHHLLKI